MKLLSLGAGVQSSTLALMYATGELGPMPNGAIFADTQSEPRSVYRWLDWLEPLLPFPIYRVTQGSLEKAALKPYTSKKGGTYLKTAIPFYTLSKSGKKGRVSHRACTRDYKLAPIFRKTRELVGRPAMNAWRRAHKSDLAAWKKYKDNQKARRKAEMVKTELPPSLPFPRYEWDAMQADSLVVQLIGISLDEMHRAKPSRDPWMRSEWPLIEARLTRQACLAWMHAHGYPEPPRSACWFCPFRSDAEWRSLRDHDPADYASAVKFDHDARQARNGANRDSLIYLHRTTQPLDQVDLATDTDRGQLTFWQDECAGICGV